MRALRSLPGKGSVKTARSVCYDILREILREARQFNPREFAWWPPPGGGAVSGRRSQHLAGLSDFIGKPISLQAESAMGQEQYDIVLQPSGPGRVARDPGFTLFAGYLL